MMVVIVLGVDLCRSVAINLDEQRGSMNEQSHWFKANSDYEREAA